MSVRISWQRVFPAVITRFHEDCSLDIDATASVMQAPARAA